ncbi:hypothetical protein QUF49_02820 [Fictibacillus sp. b24]|uniref:serine O-acetyltransferase n=1 Tax=Fictibacillus sp. b24 TaxID=3055863 RepID=UPI0025A22303|nr:hypothetical protein [Fictibacillus sp. b24]MDM5314909.1 hypothetical protein [Fictibacillus sp. b24]
MGVFNKLLKSGLTSNSNIKRKLVTVIMKAYYSSDISLDASIAETVHFCHSGFGTVINPKSIIEENVTIQHRVTIGEKNPGGGAPLIKKGSYIGAGAIVLGDIIIGENSVIGAGSVVINSIPPNSVAVGSPAKIVRKVEGDL